MHKSAIFLWLAGVSVALGQQYSITTVAGGAPPPTPVAATSTTIGQPRRVTLDSAGNIYFSAGNSVFKLSGATLTVVAGNSRPGYSGDGGPAVNAQLNTPQGLAVDKAGNLYIADSLNNRIRIVNSGGVINTFAGNGTVGYINAVGDGGPASQANLQGPSGVAVDSSGNVYIADTLDNLIREVTTDGNISTIAGDGYPSLFGDTGLATSAEVNHPEDVALDSSGNIYIADTLNAAIREITISNGDINTVVGDGSIGYAGDNGTALSAGLIEPTAVVVDSSGEIFIAEPEDGRIRKVDTKANVTTIAGNGTLGFSGDNGAATSAMFNLPTGVALDSSGNLYIADSQNNRLRKMAGTNVSTIAGNGGLSYSGDGGAATKAQLNAPQGVAADTSGNFYVADTNNNVIRKISGGNISTLLGTGTAGNGSSQLNGPQGVAADSAGNVYIADTQNARVLKVSGGTVSTVAGNGTAGYGGDGGAGGSAQLNTPTGLAVDNSGNLYIADFGNNRIRMVTPGGAITTVAGNGTQGFSGDNGAGNLAQLNGPQGVAVDKSGNIYIADTLNNRVRMVSGGAITTIAGSGLSGYTGDGGLAINAQITPVGIAVDQSGNVYISDGSAHVRKIYPGGPIFTVAGTNVTGFSGDGGLGTVATLHGPTGLAADSKGNIYLADMQNNAVRELTPTGTGSSVAAVVGAASNALGAIAPGEILVLYGSGLGPANVVTNSFNSNGVIGATLAGTTVLINGTAAPILYTSATQVSVIVPFATSGSTAQIYVLYNGQASASVSAGVAASVPTIFTADFSGKGQAAAIDQNGAVFSYNGPGSPANAGTTVSLYLTGAGQTNPPESNGAQTIGTPQPTVPVTATIGGIAVTPQYAGAAPNAVAGLWQVNLTVPAGLSAGAVPVVIKVGTVSTQPGVTIYVSGH